MTTATDEWGLLQRYALQRDERAFEALARRYVDLVYGAAVRRVGDHHLAEDITQAVFVILAQKARSIRRGPPLSAWLLMTVRCVARNAMKREARRRRHEHAAESLAASAGGACSSNPSDVLIWQEVAAVLDDAVLRLPSSDRRAILLRFFEGRSIGDVAADLNVSEGAVKQRLGRAIDSLRRRLERKGAGVGSDDAAAFAALLSKRVLVHAPVRLLGGIGATAATGAATGAGVALAKGAIRMMAWAKVKAAVFVMAAIAVAGGAGVALCQRHAAQGSASSAARAAMPTTAPKDSIVAAVNRHAAAIRSYDVQYDLDWTQMAGNVNGQDIPQMQRHARVHKIVEGNSQWVEYTPKHEDNFDRHSIQATDGKVVYVISGDEGTVARFTDGQIHDWGIAYRDVLSTTMPWPARTQSGSYDLLALVNDPETRLQDAPEIVNGRSCLVLMMKKTQPLFTKMRMISENGVLRAEPVGNAKKSADREDIFRLALDPSLDYMPVRLIVDLRIIPIHASKQRPAVEAHTSEMLITKAINTLQGNVTKLLMSPAQRTL